MNDEYAKSIYVRQVGDETFVCGLAKSGGGGGTGGRLDASLIVGAGVGAVILPGRRVTWRRGQGEGGRRGDDSDGLNGGHLRSGGAGAIGTDAPQTR